ncbi:MAG: LytTR family transcriptional regulator, partial [Tardiphaga sp.]|nr:LytTR family transcriptional regulator [Tardiphaga sp.]
MMSAFPLAFAEPLLLLGLLSLPVLWWLLRVMPPRPQRIAFPPTRLLFEIAPKEETPSRSPWWLTLLRLLAAALIIFAAAGPIWNPQTGLATSKAPLVILLDDGWTAASSWDARIKAADELIANADNDRRGVALVPLSEPTRDITILPGGTARVALRQLAPKPYAIERVETLPALERFLKATGDSELVWLSDGVDTGRGAEFTLGLGKAIGDRTLTIYDGGAAPAHALVAAENAAAKMTVKVLRANGGGIDAGVVRGLDQKGSPVGEARFTFTPQDNETEASFDLPVELRNDIARLEIAGERSAGSVQLLDKRWRRRAIGIASGSTSDTAQPLLASTFYLTRALAPFADVRLGDRGAAQQAITQFLDQKLPMIVLADVGTLSPEIRERLSAWINQGGVLVRFAGPRLAQADDDLVPVKLRRGGRSLGGSLTWEKPQHLASFAADGPFAGLAVPQDIIISRQVLAEPDAVLATKSWASLVDGTPLVTGEH